MARLGPVVARALVHPRTDGVSVLHRRVRIGDIDNNLHMNQAVYAEVFELGRAHWMVATGAWRRWRAAGANPMVARQTLTYRRELKPLQRYRVETRAVALDGRLVQLQGILAVEDRVHTLADVRLLLVGPDGVLGPDEVAAVATDALVAPARIEGWKLV